MVNHRKVTDLVLDGRTPKRDHLWWAHRISMRRSWHNVDVDYPSVALPTITFLTLAASFTTRPRIRRVQFQVSEDFKRKNRPWKTGPFAENRGFSDVEREYVRWTSFQASAEICAFLASIGSIAYFLIVQVAPIAALSVMVILIAGALLMRLAIPIMFSTIDFLRWLWDLKF